MCEFCQNHEQGDTLYEPSDWDGGIGFDYIRDIKYCPICGKKLNSEDEPQTELVNDSPILVKDLVDDELYLYDEECMRCRHLKLQCEFVPSYCKYEPRDETQTEEPPMDEYYKDHDEFYEPQERSSE